MGYTPSVLARGLVTRRTATIGVIVTTVSDPFLAPLVTGIEQIAREHGYTVLISSARRDRERELKAVQSFYERRVSGVIVTGSQLDDEYLDLRERFPMPIVLCNCRTYPHSISSDNLSGARQAVEHLVTLGHRRIAYISNRHSQRANLDRLTGYRQVLSEHGIAVEQALIEEGDGTMDGGAQAMRCLLGLSSPPTAVFCFNDLTAVGVITALHQAGYRIPADKSVVGFDDLELARYCTPPLTTVRQMTYELGKRAVHCLLALTQDQDPPPQILPAQLVIRGSTGPPPCV